MKLECVNRGIFLKGHVPSRRRLEGGAESQPEHQVKRILEGYGITFEFHVHPKPGKHRYFPDFLVGGARIIEAAGVNFDDYWDRFRRKVRDYVGYGFDVTVVVPDTLYARARRQMTKSQVEVVRVEDSEHYAETLFVLEPRRPIWAAYPSHHDWDVRIPFARTSVSVNMHLVQQSDNKGKKESGCCSSGSRASTSGNLFCRHPTW